GPRGRPPPARGRRRLAARAHRRRSPCRRSHRLRRRGRLARARPRPRSPRVPPPHLPRAVIDTVVFDLDGVLLDSEQVWDSVREQLARERGGRWHENAQRDMMGMSSPEWSRYMHDVIGLREPPEEINREVVRRVESAYRDDLPVIPGAREAVERIAARWPLGLASSSNRELSHLA